MNSPTVARHERQLRRGALINAAGALARLGHPLFFVAATRMFGTSVMGAYLVALFIVQVAVGGLTSGYHQGTVVFASAPLEDDDTPGLYAVLANAYAATLAASAALVAFSLIALEPLMALAYPGRPALAGALSTMWWSLPFAAITAVSTGATKATMRMQYDAAINGLVRPLSLLMLATIAWQAQRGLAGLALAYTGSEALVAAVSLWTVARHFSLRRLWAALRALEPNASMLRFALPQSLDVLFNRYLTRLDAIMLAAMGHTNHEVAFYSAGALLTDSLRQVRITFSTALAPIVARDHALGDREAISLHLSQVTRWTLTLGAPLLAVMLVLRDDLLALIDPAFVGDTRFMAVLLLPPLISFATGLAGNFLVFTRHSGWSLANSLAIASLNTVLNLIWIAQYGLIGAAMATSAAMACAGLLQLAELAWLERVTLRPSEVLTPVVGCAALTGAACWLWDPAHAPGDDRAILALALPLGFLALMWVLGHPEVRSLIRGLTPGRNSRSNQRDV